jgi:hypothetical protein
MPDVRAFSLLVICEDFPKTAYLRYDRVLEKEDELCSYTEDTKESPNRMDAAVFALTELSGQEEESSVGSTRIVY